MIEMKNPASRRGLGLWLRVSAIYETLYMRRLPIAAVAIALGELGHLVDGGDFLAGLVPGDLLGLECELDLVDHPLAQAIHVAAGLVGVHLTRGEGRPDTSGIRGKINLVLTLPGLITLIAVTLGLAVTPFAALGTLAVLAFTAFGSDVPLTPIRLPLTLAFTPV